MNRQAPAKRGSSGRVALYAVAAALAVAASGAAGWLLGHHAPAARIHFPETPWAPAVEVAFQRGGFLLCQRIPGRTARGDCLFHLATDAHLPPGIA